MVLGISPSFSSWFRNQSTASAPSKSMTQIPDSAPVLMHSPASGHVFHHRLIFPSDGGVFIFPNSTCGLRLFLSGSAFQGKTTNPRRANNRASSSIDLTRKSFGFRLTISISFLPANVLAFFYITIREKTSFKTIYDNIM